MNRRERVLAALNREPVDRVPLDIGGTDCSTIHTLTYKRLRDHLGLRDSGVRCGCLTQLVAEADRDLLDYLDSDVEAFWFRSRRTKLWKAPFEVELVVPERFDVEDLPDGSSVAKNRMGQVDARRATGACYFDPVATPLAEVETAADLDLFEALFERWDYSYVFDEPLDEMAARAKRQYESTDRAVVACWNLHYNQAGQLMRGYEQFLVDLLANEDLVHAMLGKLHRAYLDRVDRFLSAFGDYLDIVFLADDLGTQQTSMMSPDTYRKMIFPYTSDLVARIKSYGKKVIMHSCGAVSDFVPMFVEMGIDALNPVQVSARRMNPRELVAKHGRDITFWGGGCDTQHALNASHPEAVREDVRRRLEEFGSGASLVFTQVHNIQYDVPPENVLAMHDEFVKQTRC